MSFGNNSNNLLFLEKPSITRQESDSNNPHSHSSGNNQNSKSTLNNNFNAFGGSHNLSNLNNNPNFQRKNSIATTLISN